jgi:hypothetical protein
MCGGVLAQPSRKTDAVRRTQIAAPAMEFIFKPRASVRFTFSHYLGELLFNAILTAAVQFSHGNLRPDILEPLG